MNEEEIKRQASEEASKILNERVDSLFREKSTMDSLISKFWIKYIVKLPVSGKLKGCKYGTIWAI